MIYYQIKTNQHSYHLVSNHSKVIGPNNILKVLHFSSETKGDSRASYRKTFHKVLQKGKVSKDNKVPTSGFIGKTNLSLYCQLFEDKLPFLKEKGIKLKDLLDITIHNHDKIISNHGVIKGTEKWKAITLYATGLLEGRSPENPGWVSTGKVNKWPKVLRHLLPIYIFIKDNVDNKDLEDQIAEAMRFLLTMFKLNRVCTGSSEIDSHLSAIRSKFKLDPVLVRDFEKFCQSRLADTREGITLTDISFDIFLGPSNGPNGVPKLSSALKEAAVLKKTDMLYRAFEEMCIITDNKYFLRFFTESAKKYQNLQSELANIKLRKLAVIPDKGNKSRLVAISDFWTQSILQSIESVIIKITEQLYSEYCCFSSHSDGWSQIGTWPRSVRNDLVSLDATSWTDNLPASLQLIVVKALFGQRLSNAWKVLAVTCPWHIPGTSHTIKYGKGQGMGTKGSFVIAQLTDLLFIEFTFRKVYPEITSPKFMKVGDDLVIQDPEMKFKSEYERIGVPINETKSKFLTDSGLFIEFVSRNSWNNIDYSIISPSLVSKFIRNDYYSLILFNHIKERQADSNFQLTELFRYKEELLKDKPNFDLSKYQARKQKLLKIISLLDVINSPKVLPEDQDYWANSDKSEILDLATNLILVTLGQLVHQTEFLLNDEENQSKQIEIGDLLGEFKMIEKDGLVPDGTKHFYKAAYKNKLTFKEVIALRMAMPILRSSESNLNKGMVEGHMAPIVLPFLSKANSTFVLNPTFLEFILKTWDQLSDSSQGQLTLKRGPLFSKSKISNTLTLFKLLNNVVDSDSMSLDLTTAMYNVPTKKEGNNVLKLNLDYVQAYLGLFKFDVMLSEIDRIRVNESTQVSINTFPNHDGMDVSL